MKDKCRHKINRICQLNHEYCQDMYEEQCCPDYEESED
jgi:hypothetical protein